MTRPRVLKPDSKRRTFWISDALWAKIDKAAKADDRTVSAWLRRLIEAELDGKA